MTTQFDVVANPDGEEAAHRPYLLVLQSDLVSGLTSTIVAPLVPREQMSGAQRLNPILSVDGRDYWLATHELFAVEQRMLRRKVASLADHHDKIMGALDFLFIGF
ncbi:MAG TPA: CcdB family protein [Xanthobacteraceae bacterium]|jgi:toxin CcdB